MRCYSPNNLVKEREVIETEVQKTSFMKKRDGLHEVTTEPKEDAMQGVTMEMKEGGTIQMKEGDNTRADTQSDEVKKAGEISKEKENLAST